MSRPEARCQYTGDEYKPAMVEVEYSGGTSEVSGTEINKG